MVYIFNENLKNSSEEKLHVKSQNVYFLQLHFHVTFSFPQSWQIQPVSRIPKGAVGYLGGAVRQDKSFENRHADFCRTFTSYCPD
jgi:hypothetical protein